MQLNRKGYLAVEVILASVVAVTIAVFLMEITVKLVNITDDAYVDTELLTDKALIIKNIKKQLEEDIKNNYGIESINQSSSHSGYEIIFCRSESNDGVEEGFYDRTLYFYENQLIYQENSGDESEFYHKNLNENYLSNFSITSSKTGTIDDEEYISFQITANTKFSKNDFVADIIVQNKKYGIDG